MKNFTQTLLVITSQTKINFKMDYKILIKEAIEKANQNLSVDRQIIKEDIEQYQKREKEELEPINLLINSFFDDQLKDCDGTTIRENYVIAHKEKYFPAYKVIDRKMQWIFGEPMFNPSVEVVSYSLIKEPKIGKKVKSLHRSELEDFRIMLIDSN